MEEFHRKARAVSCGHEGGGAAFCLWCGRERAVPVADADDGAVQRLPGADVLRDVQPCSHFAGGSAHEGGRSGRRGAAGTAGGVVLGSFRGRGREGAGGRAQGRR